MKYKGYIGSVEFSEDDTLFFGKVHGIRSLISYEGATVAELVADFHGAVDDYLATCEDVLQIELHIILSLGIRKKSASISSFVY